MARGEEAIFTEYVNLMAKSINPSIDPRNDFLGFACGNFNIENFDRKSGEYPPNRFGDPFDRLMENESLNYPSVVKARNFNKSYEGNVGNLLRNEGLREFCGGFPALSESWSGENFNWIKTAAILSALGMHTVVGYTIKYEDGRRNVELSVEIPDEDVVTAVEEALKKMEIGEDKISEAVGAVNTIRKKSQSLALEGEEKELREQFLNNFFEIATGQALADDDILEMDSYDMSYVKGLLTIFPEVDPKDVANYLMCIAIFKHGEDTIFTIAHDLSMKYFAPAIIAAGFSEYWNAAEETKREEIRRRFLESFEKFKGTFADEANDCANSYMAQDKSVAEYIAQNFPQAQVDKEYDGLEISPDNYFKNVLNIIGHGTPDCLQKYHSNNAEDQDMQYQIISFLQDLVNTHGKPMLFHLADGLVEMWREIYYGFGLNEDSAEYKDLSKAISSDDPKLVKMCISTIKALKVGFDIYKTWLADNADLAAKQENTLQKLHLNNHQAFFIAFTQRFYGLEHISPNLAFLSVSNFDVFTQQF